MGDWMDADVVVVGAGTTGSAAAWMLATQGLRTVVLEARTLDAAGARWADAVPPGFFRRAGLAEPEGPELLARGAASIFLGAEGRGRITLPRTPVLHVDMRLLVARLQDLATRAGAVMVDRARVVALETGHDDRPAAVVAERRAGDGTPHRLAVRGRLFVDASGFGGTLRRLDPVLRRSCPNLAPRDACSAAMEVVEIRDKGGARTFLDSVGAKPGDAVAWLGTASGFSVKAFEVDEELERVGLLVGVSGDVAGPGGRDLLRDWKARLGWLGRVAFGGGGLIPIRRPYDRFVAPGVAMAGDAACHVFPAHASGTGSGLVAARMLADAVAGEADPGDPDVLWRYQAGFMRRHGPLLGLYDGVRRFSQQLETTQMEALLQTGLLRSGSFHDTLAQQMLAPGAGDVAAVVRATLSRPDLVARAGVGGARALAAYALYRVYPEHPNPLALRVWARAVATALGDRPDAEVSEAQ